jgi:hypothetical protein
MNINTVGTNNTIANNAINTITSAGIIYGITTAAGNDNIYSNTINGLISSGTLATIVNGIAITSSTTKKCVWKHHLQANNITTGSVSGIAVTGGAINNIYRNKIYAISSSSSGITGSVNGILVSGGIDDLTNIIYNNRIGDIKATAAKTNQ